MFSDTHAHIDFRDFESDLDEVVFRSWENGIKAIIVPGIDAESAERARVIAEKNPQIWFAVGWHPHDAVSFNPKILERYSNHPKCVAIGEMGLDFYRDISPREIQVRVFEEQLRFALEKDIPVIIHIRDAWETARKILDNFTKINGVLHAFSGGMEELEWGIQKGFYIGLGGPITYPNFKKTDVIKKIPLDKLLTETDCPFLAPQSMRGKRNEPSFVVEIARKIAEVKGISIDELGKITTSNTRSLFGITYRSVKNTFSPKKYLSQNFLFDKNYTRKITELLDGGELCVEIGSGHGELSSEIAKKFTRFWAIEPDWDILLDLKARAPNAIIVPKTFEKISLERLTCFEGGKAEVIGNLPYNSTSPILFKLLEERDFFSHAVLMVQKEFADRMIAKPSSKEYGIPTVLFGLFFEIKREFDVPPSCFKPAPKVSSSVLTLRKLANSPAENVEFDILKRTVHSAFAHRRKTVLNSMKMELEGINIKEILVNSGIDPHVRAETIEPERFVKIASELQKAKGEILRS